MEKIANIIKQMFNNIFVTDWIVFLGLILSFIALAKIKDVRHDLKNNINKMPNNPDWADKLRKKLNKWYSVFTSSITLYPLLGMFGTVISLINVGNVDFSQASESLNAIKGDFFTALTSTAWGIIWAAVFKIRNSFLQPKVEDDMRVITSLVEKLKEENGTKYQL